MTGDEKAKRIEELEEELKLLDAKEIAKHNTYYEKKMQLHTLKDKEKIEELELEISKLSRDLVGLVRRKIEIRMELQELSKEHKLLQYADRKKR